MKKLIFALSLLFSANAFAGTVSFDQLAVSSDLTVAKYNADLNRIYQEFNSNIESSNIAVDAVAEVDMADNANPRIRTYEGASCEKVYEGLLTTTTSGTLVGSVPAGTAYPLGYRVVKVSSTPKTFSASKWTFVDIDINGDFTYSEVAIDGATPAVATNSIRLSRVSTDSTQVVHVSDLRTTSCATGPFSIIRDAASQASLGDLLSTGKPVRNRGAGGFIQGLHISWDTTTTFKVTSGGAYINGKYRITSADITVPQTADGPSTGVSGLDTGAIAASTRYNVFAVADQDSVNTLSASFSTSAAPTGITNYRKIGEIKTDAASQFTSADILVTHGIRMTETVSSWVHFSGVNNTINASSNVSSFTDNGTGDYTFTWDYDYTSANYSLAGMSEVNAGTEKAALERATGGQVAGSVRIHNVHVNTGSLVDSPVVSVQATGERS